MRIVLGLSFLVLAAAAITGCNGQPGSPDVPVVATAPVDQDTLCVTNDWRAAGDCKVGQKIAFLPESWGNQQLPVLFIAKNCDMRHQVALTEGGAVCIYKPQQPKEAQPAASRASQ